MPLFNSNENKLLSSLEDAYREMNEENYMERRKREQRARAKAKPDEEVIQVKPEPAKPKYDAQPQNTKRLKTRNMRKGEGLGVKPLANRAQKNAGRGDEGQPDLGGRAMRG